jgi:hypothetical protein
VGVIDFAKADGLPCFQGKEACPNLIERTRGPAEWIIVMSGKGRIGSSKMNYQSSITGDHHPHSPPRITSTMVVASQTLVWLITSCWQLLLFPHARSITEDKASDWICGQAQGAVAGANSRAAVSHASRIDTRISCLWSQQRLPLVQMALARHHHHHHHPQQTQQHHRHYPAATVIHGDSLWIP